MKPRKNVLSASIYGVLLRQVAITLITAVVFSVWHGYHAGVSAAFGGLGAIVVTGLLAWRLVCLERRMEQGGQAATAAVMLNAALRFLLVIAWLATGLTALALQALPLVVAFALAHIGYLGYLLKSHKLKGTNSEL